MQKNPQKSMGMNIFSVPFHGSVVQPAMRDRPRLAVNALLLLTGELLLGPFEHSSCFSRSLGFRELFRQLVQNRDR